MNHRAFSAVLILLAVSGCSQREDSCNAYLEAYGSALTGTRSDDVAGRERENKAIASALERVDPRDAMLDKLYEAKLELHEQYVDILRKYPGASGDGVLTPAGFDALVRRNQEIDTWGVDADANQRGIDDYCAR